MTFFKADKKNVEPEELPFDYDNFLQPKKPRYVIENGKGRWVRPKPLSECDFCEDVLY